MKNDQIKLVSRAKLPTRYGTFSLCGFTGFMDGKDHVALVRGDVTGAFNVPVRIHSECLTGDALGSLRCDCGPQLTKSLKKFGRSKRGVLIYLKQEGRGIGLLNKIRAYALQDKGLDTYDANVSLGFEPDERKYDAAVGILRALQVQSVVLQTNNPDKLESLENAGLVVCRSAHTTRVNGANKEYLATKRKRFGHML